MLCSSEATKRNREDGDRSEAGLAWCRFGDLNVFLQAFIGCLGYITLYTGGLVFRTGAQRYPRHASSAEYHTFQRASLVHVVPSPEP